VTRTSHAIQPACLGSRSGRQCHFDPGHVLGQRRRFRVRYTPSAARHCHPSLHKTQSRVAFPYTTYDPSTWSAIRLSPIWMPVPRLTGHLGSLSRHWERAHSCRLQHNSVLRSLAIFLLPSNDGWQASYSRSTFFVLFVRGRWTHKAIATLPFSGTVQSCAAIGAVPS
jgi:hypothetical protein